MHATRSHHRRRGSVLGLALILALVVALILTTLVKWSATERDITLRHVALSKARMTAESVDQYGAAQIKARLDQLTYFDDDEFRPENNAPELPAQSLLEQLLGTKGHNGNGYAKGAEKGGGNDDDDDDDDDEGGGLLGLLDDVTEGVTNTLLPNRENIDRPPPAPEDGYFRYEITPENLVVGRFQPARWERIDDSNPLYVGDPLIDQTVRVREVRMVSAARAFDAVRRTTLRSYCESFLQVRDSPVWGNVLFYNMDMEVAPGPAMDLHGPVHTNGHLYVQSDESVRFHDSVTAAGHLYHGRITHADGNGSVQFRKAGTTTFVSLQQGGGWIDSRTTDWASRASTLWAGNVRTRDHGINASLPAGVAPYVPDDPATAADEWQNPARVLIEKAVETTSSRYPGDAVELQKFATKACLVIDVASSGAVTLYKYEPSSSGRYMRDNGLGPEKSVRRQLNVPSGLIVGGTASNRFYDMRRGEWVFSLDLDVGRLKALIENAGEASAFTRSGVKFDPATEWNGVVYLTHGHTSRGGVRLVNGSRIPSRPTSANGNTKGFTFATDAPLYVQGHYNADGVIGHDTDRIRQPDSTSEPPAGLAADAITILSTAWSDARSDRGLGERRAQATEVAAAFLAGLVPTNKNGNGIYSGGVQNLPRLLEDWNGVTFGYRGSIVVLYESEFANEAFGSTNVYYPPRRVWGFNQLFADGILPPGTPQARSYRRIGFRDISAQEYQEALNAINNGG